MKKYLFLLLLITTFAACKKEKVYEEVIIPDNEAPPDSTVSLSRKTTYVNKVYISLLGRKPSDAEEAEGISILNRHELSFTDRGDLLDLILLKPDYKPRWYEIARADLLNNMDTTEVTFFIAVLNNALATQPLTPLQIAQVNMEIDKLELLQKIPADILNNNIDIIEMYKRCINNYFYDQLNMGTENFVISSFQNFFYRYPTQSELEKGKRMVDGLSADLFFQFGTTKDDYLNIFFSSDNFFEGQVRSLYKRYLFREPTSEESARATGKFKNSHNYQEMQKDILSTNEYAGLK